MKNTELLLQVAAHKSVFFASAAAQYVKARPGSLRLVPPKWRLDELRRDYENMREMIFGTAPAFENIIASLETIESAINNTAS